MRSFSRYLVLACGVVGTLLAQELHGQDTPTGGACPGDPRGIYAGLTLFERRTGIGSVTTYTLIARARQSASIPTGHEMAAQMQRWQMNAAGQFVVEDIK